MTSIQCISKILLFFNLAGIAVSIMNVDNHPKDRSTHENIMNSPPVVIFVKHNITGKSLANFYIDPTIRQFNVVLHGSLSDAQIITPNGTKVQLDYIKNRPESRFTVDAKQKGLWVLMTDGNAYGIIINANSPLSMETKQKFIGNNTHLILSLDSSIKKINNLNLLDQEGNLIKRLNYNQEADLQHDTENFEININNNNTNRKTFTEFELELDPNFTNGGAYIQLNAQNLQGDQLTRLTTIPEYSKLPTSIEVGLGSKLTAESGQTASIYFEVTNNRREGYWYNFLVTDNSRLIQNIYPTRSFLQGKSTVQVRVDMIAPNNNNLPGTSDIVSFTTEKLPFREFVTKKAYFRVGSQVYDASGPYIWYDYKGDCSNTIDPDNCHVNSWGANVTIQDTVSGIIKIKSKPFPLLLANEFIAGTKDYIYGQISSTCCFTKVEVTAIDAVGNSYSRTINIERKWLTAGEITAITLGIILLIIIIIAIIVGIVLCRRDRATLNIYPYQ